MKATAEPIDLDDVSGLDAFETHAVKGRAGRRRRRRRGGTFTPAGVGGML
jgi:hypothetical protein